MPPRRSARAASAKPIEDKPTKSAEKPTKSKSQPPKKRAASPERTASPPPKRSRTTTSTKKQEKGVPTRSAARKATPKALAPKKINGAVDVVKPRSKRSPVSRSIVPPLNPLPTPPPKSRPGLHLWVWGTGNFGQFGMGPDILGEIDKPKKSTWVEEQMQAGTFGEEGAGLESICAGGLHTLFIDEKGTVWSCGVNDDAALGRVTQNVPNPETPDEFLDIDELTSYPHPLKSLVDEGFRAVQLASGDSICAAVSAEGELRVWGSFRVNEGSLGFSSGLRHQFTPVPILDFKEKAGVTEKVSSIAAGCNHIIVLTTHGNIYTWGAGEQAQLGRKVLERRKIHGTVPEKITLGSRSRKAVKIGAGAYHSFAVDEAGDVWGWGLNSMGQTGTGYTSEEDKTIQLPRKVERLSRKELGDQTIVQIAGGNHHTLFLTSGGKVYACGRSNAGQLGLADGDEAFKDREYPEFLPEPVLVTFPDPSDPVVRISVGSHNNMAVTHGGALYCWGQGIQGELGVPDEEVKTPRMIVRKEGGSWTAIDVSCGGQHTLGLFRKKS